MACLNDEDLDIYLTGKMDEQDPRFNEIEEHLLVCESCIDRASAIHEMIRALSSSSAPQVMRAG